jgi:3-oxoacyl-[acyl-carrier-protein] synthase-3
MRVANAPGPVLMSIGIHTLVTQFPEAIEAARAHADTTPRPPACRRIARQRDAAERLAGSAARKALAVAGLTAADLDLVIAHHLGGQYIMPSVGAAIHAAIGAPLELPAYGLQSAEATFIDACFLAQGMIEGDPEIGRVLVVTATAMHTGGWGVDPTSASGATWGDGAAAALISRDAAMCEIAAYAHETCGEVYDACVVDFAGPERPAALDAQSPANAAMLHASAGYDGWLRGEGRRALRRTLERALGHAKLSLAQLDFVIPHQITGEILDAWQRDLEAFGLPPGRWRHSFERYGNAGAADVAATLVDLAAAGELHRGDAVACLAPAIGGHCAAMILRWQAPVGE